MGVPRFVARRQARPILASPHILRGDVRRLPGADDLHPAVQGALDRRGGTRVASIFLLYAAYDLACALLIVSHTAAMLPHHLRGKEWFPCGQLRHLVGPHLQAVYDHDCAGALKWKYYAGLFFSRPHSRLSPGRLADPNAFFADQSMLASLRGLLRLLHHPRGKEPLP